MIGEVVTENVPSPPIAAGGLTVAEKSTVKLSAPHGSRIEMINHQTVLGRIVERLESRPQLLKFRVFQPAFEQTVLHANTKILARVGYPLQAPGIHYIISNES